MAKTNMESRPTTLEGAREIVKSGALSGVNCPCCEQYVKRYNRPMHARMAASLIALYKMDRIESKPYHISEFATTYNALGDFAKLRFWKFIKQEEKGEEEDKRTSGRWSITEGGRDFVMRKISAPARVIIQDNEFIDFDGNPIMIEQVLKKKFSYEELMR